MSWMQRLAETYDNCEPMVGYSTDESNRPLLPIGHMAAQAHIEIVINQEGGFLRARVVTDKNTATTIIPCTEPSGSRAGKKPECHPLCDQLQYVAGDFVEYGGTVTSGFLQDPEEPFRNYLKILTGWCTSEFGHPKAQAVLSYAKKKRLISDLVAHQILFVGQDHRFLPKRESKRQKDASDVFSVVASQETAFIRWEVEIPEALESKTWKDKTLWESWIQYYFSTKEKEPFCYVNGQDDFLSIQHPKYIRAKGDGAKLISSNDSSGFTYRGRFVTAGQACKVGFEVSQKAHNGLIWLISRQGKVFFVKGDRGRMEPGLTVVAWATSGKAIPKVTDDSLSILGFDDLPNDETVIVSTAQEVAIRFRNRMLGYASELGNADSISVMALDSASKGRLAITYYRENLTISEFLERIENWHTSCTWVHEYRYKDVHHEATGKTQRFFQPFVGAPAPGDIAESAYGRNMDDKLKKAVIVRILPCIIDGIALPRDIVDSAVRRACNRTGMEGWEWNKTLSIACALFRRFKEKEGYDMALDEGRKTRDYLYGRLLALADSLEQWALNEAGENRQTNAARLMQRFADRPYSTWKTIELSLGPYKARLGGQSKKRQELIDRVHAMFDPPEDYADDKPLSGEFLLGYHCQREALKPKGNANTNENEQETDEEATE